MPWTLKDALSHTKKADTSSKQKQWAEVANAELKANGDEARAIRSANAVIRDHPAHPKPPQKHWSGKN